MTAPPKDTGLEDEEGGIESQLQYIRRIHVYVLPTADATHHPASQGKPDVRAGVIIPQRKYTSGPRYQQLDSIRFVEDGHPGVSLLTAYDEDYTGMPDASTIPLIQHFDSPRTACRLEVCLQDHFLGSLPADFSPLQWPGYDGWFQNISVVDRTAWSYPISKGRWATLTAKAVLNFIEASHAHPFCDLRVNT